MQKAICGEASNTRSTQRIRIGGRIVALIIRPLAAQDLSEASRIIRRAFGTARGVPEPEQFWVDIDYAHTRWRADPTAAFGAERDGELVGSNLG